MNKKLELELRLNELVKEGNELNKVIRRAYTNSKEWIQATERKAIINRSIESVESSIKFIPLADL